MIYKLDFLDLTSIFIFRTILGSFLNVVIIYFGYVEKLDVFPKFFIAIITGSGMYLLRSISSYLYKMETLGIGDVKLSF